jgi:hypothetical protein
MFDADEDEGTHMVVGEAIDHLLAIAPRRHKVAVPEQAQLMADRGLRHVTDLYQLVDAQFPGGK